MQPLARVPAALAPLVRLTFLSFEGCHLELEGFSHLRDLAGLRHLDLRQCALGTVPEVVSHFTSLTQLDLAFNEWSDLPVTGWEHLAPLVHLASLSMKSCELGEVPEELSGLTALSSLSMGGGNTLCWGWEHLAPLGPSLRYLALAIDAEVAEVPGVLTALTGLT